MFCSVPKHIYSDTDCKSAVFRVAAGVCASTWITLKQPCLAHLMPLSVTSWLLICITLRHDVNVGNSTFAVHSLNWFNILIYCNMLELVALRTEKRHQSGDIRVHVLYRLVAFLFQAVLTCLTDVLMTYHHRFAYLLLLRADQRLALKVKKRAFMPYANSEGLDQPAHPHSLIRTFAVRYRRYILQFT